jgi:hypothetical protein
VIGGKALVPDTGTPLRSAVVQHADSQPENIYTDIVSATGGADTVTDTLVTPFGTSPWTGRSAVSTPPRRWTPATPSPPVSTPHQRQPPPSTR